ncbi:MAG TPA: hypothetical protein VFJ85_04715 [Acidimicrobiales bacterium]|nr:hypothetical protein [Acidimicrobiales bacterium]
MTEESDPQRRKFSSLSNDPDTLLDGVLDALREAGEDETEIASIGAGRLESLFHGGLEGTLWPRIEDLARHNPAFRRALRSAWAYGSPMFDRRQALLRSLGEFDDVTVRFVAIPEGFPVTTGYSWRSFRNEGPLRPEQLAGLLRQIANSLERDGDSGDEGPSG